MAKKPVDVEFKFIDNFTTSFKKTIATLTSGTVVAQRAWKGVEKAGKGIASFGDSITKAVTLPVVGMGVAGVKSFGEVDKTLRLVKETMGSSTEEATALESSLKKAAASSVFGMQDAADATLNFARQGFSAGQAADMLTPALNLAAGTATDLSSVTAGLGNTLKSFSASSNQATHYADMFAKAQAQANTTVEGLFDTMSIAGSTANNIGWTFSDLAVITGVFGDVGKSASEGATALNTGLMRLASPAKQGASWLDKLGISVFDSNGKLKPMVDTMAELRKGFEGLSDEDSLAAASAIFGKAQASNWLSLLQGSATVDLQVLKDNIDNVAGSAQNMADALMSGVGGSIEKLKSSFDVFKYTVGSLVGDTVTGFIDKITGLIDRFNNMDTAQQKQIIKWASMAAVVGPAIGIFGRTVSIIGKVGNTLSGLGMFVKSATTGFKAMSGGASILRVGIAALTSPAGLIIAALAAIAIVVVSVVTHFDTFKATLNTSSPTMQKLKANFDTIMAAIKPLIPKIIEIADAIGNGIAAGAGIAVSALAGFLNGGIDTVKGLIKWLSGIIDFVTGVFTGDWEKAWGGIVKIFTGLMDVITGTINTIKKGIMGLIDGIKGLSGANAGVQTTVNGTATGAGRTIPMKAAGDLNWAGGLVQVHEKGGEIIDLPHGTRIYPHDKSIAMARGAGNTNINIPKFADQIIVRSEVDIEQIGRAVARQIMSAKNNRGRMSFSANMA